MEEKEKEDNILIPLNEKKEIGNEMPINIFFVSKEEKDNFSDLKSLFLNSNKKNFVFKGEYNMDSIVNKVCYYLGIETENYEEIDEKEIRNIIIFNIPSNEAINILQSFVKKIDGNIGNDEYPFFIFLKNKNCANDFDIKTLIIDLNKFQEEVIDSSKLDSRNIYIDTEETILDTINKIYNYYNGDYILNFGNDEDEKGEKYYIDKTINILVIGKRGCGKSTLINRILGEKKAFAHINAKTPETREYYHRYYPIKLIDSAGFEVSGLDEKKTNEIKDIKKFLEKNNLDYKNIKKRVHFIFYVFRANDKFDDSVIQILKEFQTYNIETIFIITYSKQGEEKMYKNNFKDQIKKNNIFPKEKINNIINNTFCIDSFNIKYSKTISDIFIYISGILKEYEESNNTIIDAIENCKMLIKNKVDDNNIFDNENDLSFLDICNDIPPSPTPMSSDLSVRSLSLSSSRFSVGLNIAKDTEGGKIFKKTINNPKETIETIKSLIQSNIFLTDFKSERLSKKKLAKEVVEDFRWPGFWWSSFMIPILNQYLAKKSKLKMLRKISKIYGIEIPKDYDEKYFDSIKEGDGKFKKFMKTIGTWVAGYWNFNDIKKIGNKIIEEFDLEYTKKNILDLYMDMAVKYNESFRLIQNFYTCFNQDYWYDIRLKNNDNLKNN